MPVTEQLRQWAGGRLNWLLYFQEPGLADTELGADPRLAGLLPGMLVVPGACGSVAP